MPAPRFFSVAAALMLALVSTAGCEAPRLDRIGDTALGAPTVWPPPPADARIRFVRSVSGPEDLGISPSLLRRMLSALSGSESEHFVRPTGVAAQGAVLYVADPGAAALWILDARRGRYIKLTAAGGTTLVSPVAVTPGPENTVFVADSGTKQVYLIESNGDLVRVAAPSGIERPAALGYDRAARRLYVADSVRHRVALYREDGTLVQMIGGPGAGDGEFNFPTHLSVAKDGSLLVTDALNFRIQAFDPQGRFLWKFGRQGDGSGDFAAPKGLAADADGHIFVVDALFDAVQIFEPDGSFLLAFGTTGAQAGQFSLPGGMYIDAQGQIYVADAHNGRVQVFSALASDKAVDR